MAANYAQVVIIGAGAAGLMAAAELSKSNFSVVVIEALPRIGGRVYTLHEGFSTTVEGGAEFIHGSLPVTFGLINEATLRTSEVNGTPWRINAGALQQGELFNQDWQELTDALAKLEMDIPMSVFLQRFFNDKKYADLIRTVKSFVEGYDAADLDRVSAFALRDEWMQGDDSKQYRLIQGYGELIQYLCKKCKVSGVKFETGTSVERIDWSEGKVSLTSKDGRRWESRYAIITVSIGVLLAGKIKIIPTLPEYDTAAKTFGFGGVIKFLFEFETKIWEAHSAFRHIPSLGFLFSDALIPTWWTQSPENTAILTGWLAGPAARKYNHSKEALFNMAIDSLSYLFSCEKSILLKTIKHWEIVNWLTDEHFLGAYAYATPETSEGRKTLNSPVANTLFFAGEALYEGPEMGTVEAALASGRSVAERITH